MDAETFDFSCDGLMFQVQLSDGSSRELMPGGASKAVTVENREQFVELLVDARLHEIDLQCDAIRYVSDQHSLHYVHVLRQQNSALRFV